MKQQKQLLYLFTLTLLLYGCISEDMSDCEGTVYFNFQYNNSSALFDEVIANEVHFNLFHEDVLQTGITIPFDIVKGGQSYGIKKAFTGKTEVIVWAVPVSEPTAVKIPVGTVGRPKEEAGIELEQLSGDLHRPLDFLHRGVGSWVEENLTQDSHIPVSLSPAVCRLKVILHDDGSFLPENQPGIEVSGLQKELSMELVPSGDDIVIEGGTNLVYNENKWNTGQIYLPPSLSGKTLSVKVTPSGRQPFTIHTNYESVAGEELELEVRGNRVQFFVNGWRKESLFVEGL